MTSMGGQRADGAPEVTGRRSRKMHRRMIVGSFLAALVLGVGLLEAHPDDAKAAYPGSSGKIVFAKDRAIHLANPDGSEDVRVSAPPTDVQHDSGAKISADGQRVVFLRGTDAPPQSGCHPTLSCFPSTEYALYAVDVDGSNETLLKKGWASHDSFDVSPDGRDAIAMMQGSTETRIVALDLPTGEERQLGTVNGGAAWSVDVSPDGRSLAFNGRCLEKAGRCDWENHDSDMDVYASNLDGSGLRQLTNDPAAADHLRADDLEPEWAPDGRRLAFSRIDWFADSSDSPSAVAVGTVSANGTEAREVWNQQGDHGSLPELDGLLWSPDGRRIGFGVNGAAAEPGTYRYLMVDPDGSDLSSTDKVSSPSDWQALPTVPGSAPPETPPEPEPQPTPEPQPAPPSPAPNAKPKVTGTRPAPGSVTRDRTPPISAIVGDTQEELKKTRIRILVDSRPRTFSYNPATDKAALAPSLAKGRHTVRVQATDSGGLKSSRQWAFYVR